MGELRRAGMCEALCKALVDSPHGKGVVAVSEAIRDCALDDETRGAMGKAGVCDAIVACLQPDPSQPVAESTGLKRQLAALQALRNLAFSHPPNRDCIGAAGGCEAVVLLLRSTPNPPSKLVAAAAQAVRDLGRDSAKNKASLLAAGAAKAVVSVLARELDAGLGAAEAALRVLSIEARVALLEAIRVLAYENAEGRTVLGEQGACQVVAKVFGRHVPRKSGENAAWQVVAAAAQAISYLAYSHDANRKRFGPDLLAKLKLMDRQETPSGTKVLLQHAARMLALQEPAGGRGSGKGKEKTGAGNAGSSEAST
mmetsp:Transcript_3541/g.8299  ORF Transcript_3541/g.8299 Transcript_3541/m.8299 type:complete len:312 (+) Transcript_3541:3-938(+)